MIVGQAAVPEQMPVPIFAGAHVVVSELAVEPDLCASIGSL